MRAYGKKHDKTRAKVYSCGHENCYICSNSDWKVSKTRERKNIDEDLNLTPQEDENLQYEDFEAMIVIEPYGDEGYFKGISNLLDMECIAYDPDETLEKMYHKYINYETN